MSSLGITAISFSVFEKQFGSSEDDSINEIAIDSNGNILATGSTDGGLDGKINQGNSDVFLVKFSPSGEKQPF